MSQIKSFVTNEDSEAVGGSIFIKGGLYGVEEPQIYMAQPSGHSFLVTPDWDKLRLKSLIYDQRNDFLPKGTVMSFVTTMSYVEITTPQ
jgi:hypothetical protein